MPRHSRGPYLKLRKRAGAKPIWYIHDGDSRITTLCLAEDREGARQALADYLILAIAKANYGERSARDVTVAEVLTLYAIDCVPHQKRQDDAEDRMERLTEFFGRMVCDDITPSTTAAYTRWRTHSGKPIPGEPLRVRKPVKGVTARRELEHLSAALRHAWKSRKLASLIPVTLPEQGARRERWLTTSEAARLLMGALGYILVPACDVATKAEHWRVWRREPHAISRHLARFILIGLRTGTRHDAILGLGWYPHPQGGFFDLDEQLMFRAPSGFRQTKKRQTPAPIPRILMRHLPRWKRLSASLYVVSAPGYSKRRMRDVGNAFMRAVAHAGLGSDVTPHILRHTCVTWLMQRGRPAWEVGGFVGMSTHMIEAHYGHHSPGHLVDTANALRPASNAWRPDKRQ